MQAPFSLRTFVADGDPDGLRIVEHFNVSGPHRRVTAGLAAAGEGTARAAADRVYFL